METCYKIKEKAYVMTMTKEEKSKLIVDFAKHEGDTGSPEVQIAILTKRINQLTDHLRANKSDESSRRGLLKMVGHRAHLLKYLATSSPDRYQSLIDRLGLRR